MERYAAFISYSHSDEDVARWLHRGIEGYRFPTALVGSESAFGPVPKRLPPVFRDRDELAASADLGADLRAALAASRYQIVICSPRAAASKWVNEEILAFKRTHGEQRTLALIAQGEPYSGGADECFPPALRFTLGPDGALSDKPAEPIAADIRKGKDGRRLALLKLLSGIAGVRLDALAQRDAARRQRQLAYIAAGSLAVAVMTIGLAIYAEAQRRVAVEQKTLADRSLEFLTGTFAIANPATENPRTITALTILDRASRDAAREFAGQPKVSSRLLRTTGDIYYNLGLYDESERDLRKALAMEPGKGDGRAQSLLKLAAVERQRSNVEKVEALIREAEKAYDRRSAGAPMIEARVLEMKGHVAYLKADYARSARLQGAAVEKYRTLGSDSMKDRVRAMRLLANALNQSGKIPEGLRLMQATSEITRSIYGPNDVRVATSYQNEALALFESGDIDAARRTLKAAIGIFEVTLEKNHPFLAAAHFLFGRIENASRKYTNAKFHFDQGREIFLQIHDQNNVAVGDIDFYAAEAEAGLGRLDRAMALLANTKRIYDAAYGPDDPDQAELLLQSARILAKSGKTMEARSDCLDALTLQKRISMDQETLNQTAAMCATIRPK